MAALDRLRRPLFLIAVALFALAVLVEAGASLLRGELDEDAFRTEANRQLRSSVEDSDEREDLIDQVLNGLQSGETGPPGKGVPYLLLLDGLVLYTVMLIGLALLIPERVHGRIQGIASLIVSLVVLIVGIILIIKTFIELLIMVALFIAAPFGTIAYLARWGFFDRPGASLALSTIMFLKLCFAGCLVFAHQRFLQNKGLVLIIITSLLATFIVGFLHALVPLFLVSITDAVAAIVGGILAVIWAIFFLVLSIISIVKAIL